MPGGRLPGTVSSEQSPRLGADASGLLSPGAVHGPQALELRTAAKPHEVTSLDFLFTQRREPTLGLSDQDYQSAAARLSADVAAIKAVAQVETMGKAFDHLGRPTILFERHHFHRHTGGKYDATHPTVSDAEAGGYGKLSAQYDKLKQAYELDQEAALKSASWGRFQIMGSNHAACGFDAVRSFVLAVTRSEAAHLDAFVSFVASNKTRLEALRNKDWATFAKMYNGAGYAKRGYDGKMKSAYDTMVAAQAALARTP